MKRLVAVETSDIVGSTKLSTGQLASVMAALKECHQFHQDSHQTMVEYYRGDAYQVMYPCPVWSIKGLLLTKLHLMSSLDFRVDITQSLALGYVEQPIKHLHDSMHEVFIASGRQLDNTRKGTFALNANMFDEAFMLSTAFLNRLLQNLSTKQAEILYWYIQGNYPEHKKIASQLNMTRQNVNTHLIRANADLVKQYIDFFQRSIDEVSKLNAAESANSKG